MINRKLIFNTICLTTLLFTAGCASIWKNTYTAPTYFDIGTPSFKFDKNPTKQIELIMVKTSDPYNEYMVFRQGETHLLIDSYNCWAASPDEMLKQYMVLGFNQSYTNRIEPINPNRFQLSVSILRLEADLTTKEANIALNVSVFDAVTNAQVYSEVIFEKEPLNEVTGQNFSIGVKTIIDRIINKINSDLNAVPLK